MVATAYIAAATPLQHAFGCVRWERRLNASTAQSISGTCSPKYSSHERSGFMSHTVPWSPRLLAPNDISIGTAVLAGLTDVTSTHTHRQTSPLDP